MKKIVGGLILISLFGAGCAKPAAQVPETPATPSQSQKAAPAVPTRMGFGKLPSIGSTGALGSPEAISARATSAVASPVPMMANATAVAVEGSVSVDAKMRPIPVPPNLRPVSVKYSIKGTMPTWSGESEVLEVQPLQTDVGMLRSFATNAGLPSAIVSGISEVQSVQVSWKDASGFMWNTDGASHTLNWWKNQDNIQPMMATNGRENQNAIKQDDAKVIATAEAFLRSHGLGSVADQGATVEPYINQPCLMKEVATPDMMVRSDISPTMYPSPCAYVQTQVNVYFGANREGKPVVDMGGWPSRLSSVNVDLATMSVTGGNVVYSENLTRSAYPLLDSATVLKRLQEGGRNPVYPWGGESKDIQVTIDKVELAWLRFDSWADNKQQTYYIPAISASGHVNRGMIGQEPEEYHTTVALVKDDAFAEESAVTGSGGGTVQIMPVVAPAGPAAY